MMRKALFLLVFIFNFTIILLAQQSSWPKTLLWRISGNGLSKNSFLYGTMHLQDKRLFYFGDSLYKYLEQAEGYALEVDIQEFMDSLIQKAISEKEDEMLRDEENVKEDKQLIDSLITKLRLSKDKSTRKMLERLRQKKIKRIIKNQEMPTILDAYLYGIARRQGKWLGGIEDVQDQLSLFDEMGNNVQSKDLLASDAQLIKSLEEMIGMYLSQDLNAIEEYSLNQYTDEFESKIFFQRNKKMVTRMDSLAGLRSMFFAVGAAHLPGDSGVITLLRKKGYTVDPVFSSQKIDPVKYAATLDEVPWVNVEDADNTYKVEMPGKPSDVTMFGDFVKMKVFVDITTLTYFMSGSVMSQQDVDPDKMLQQISRDKKNKVENKRKIENNGVKGVEGIMYNEGFYYKVQYLVKDKVLYMLMAGGNKKEIVTSEASKKFFTSFNAKEVSRVKAAQKEWQSFGVEDKAFRIMLPGVPKRNRSLEKSADGSNWSFTVYDLNDIGSSVYYLIQVRDLLPGYYLTGDSVFFNMFRENLPGSIGRITKEERTNVATFPAYRIEAEDAGQKLIYRTLVVNRGNRVYLLMAVAEKKTETESHIDRFVKSFEIEDYKTKNIEKRWDADRSFYSNVKYAFEEKKPDDEEEDESGSKHYISYCPDEVISYEVFKTVISPYYWAGSDSIYFADIEKQYKSYSDSVLEKRPVVNGNLRGMEWVIQMPQNNNRKRFRHFISGDTSFTLISFIPAQYIRDDRHNQFFDGFRVVNEKVSLEIYKSKAKKLLADLVSTDSATVEKASAALINAEFEKADKELLEEALLVDYSDDTTGYYYTTRDRIADKLQDLADDGTVEFIRSRFADLKGSNEHIKFDLLTVLANYKTEQSYGLLKELLLKQTPKGEARGKELSYRLTDSLPLTKILYPEILMLSNNILFAERIIGISREMIDSSYISIGMLIPYKENFLYTADTIRINITQQNEDEFWGGNYADVINLLGRFNDDDCNTMLQKYLLLNDLEIKKETVVNLLKNNQLVNEKEIEKLAASKEYRRDIYNRLKEIGKEKYFSAKYLTQKYMAESDMYSAATDDEDIPSEIKYLSDKTVMYKGGPKRFYLFRITYKYKGEEGEKDTQYSYLGIAGPFSEDIRDLQIDENISGLYYDEEFDSKRVNSYFNAYMEALKEE